MKKFLSKIIFFLARTYWFIFRPKEYGAKAIVKKGNEILCIRQGWGGKYTFPGGRVDKNEIPEETIKRELKEEVGVYPDTVFYIGAFVSRVFYKYDTVFVYLTELKKETEIKIDNFEVIEARWFSKDNLPELGPVGRETYSVYEKHITKQNK